MKNFKNKKRTEKRMLSRINRRIAQEWDKLDRSICYSVLMVDYDKHDPEDKQDPFSLYNNIFIAEFDKIAKTYKLDKERLDKEYRAFHQQYLDSGIEYDPFWSKVWGFISGAGVYDNVQRVGGPESL